MLAFAAAAARGDFGAEVQVLGEEILAELEKRAERLDELRARRGQLVFPIALARCYPTLPPWPGAA